LIEAARIDGAGEIWIFWRIIIPLSTGPLAALAIFTFLFSWDDYILPSIVLTDPSIKTLPLVLAGLRNLYWQRYELYAAGSMLTVVPVMLLYALMQRHFVRGITLTGLR
jgi:multiple sugar transport system permease protein